MRFALLFCASALTLLADTSQLGYLGRTYTVVEINDLFVTYRVTDPGTNTANYEPIYAARGGAPKNEFVDIYREPFLPIDNPNYPVTPGRDKPAPCGPCSPPPVRFYIEWPDKGLPVWPREPETPAEEIPEPRTLLTVACALLAAMAVRIITSDKFRVRCRGIAIGDGNYTGCGYGTGRLRPYEGPRDCPVCCGSGLER